MVADRINIKDSNDLAASLSRWMHIAGGPGTGKTEAIIHATYRAAKVGARVLILCPTGTLAHAYTSPTDRLKSGRDVTWRFFYCPKGGLEYIFATWSVAPL